LNYVLCLGTSCFKVVSFPLLKSLKKCYLSNIHSVDQTEDMGPGQKLFRLTW